MLLQQRLVPERARAGGDHHGGRCEPAGTSQTSPHVAGMIAVLKSAFPGDWVDQNIARMTSTGTPVTDTRNGIVKPRINVQAATGSSSVPLTCTPQTLACPGNANGSLGSGDCTTGLRNEGQYTDAYSFSGTAGQSVSIDLSGSFDTYVILVSPPARSPRPTTTSAREI